MVIHNPDGSVNIRSFHSDPPTDACLPRGRNSTDGEIQDAAKRLELSTRQVQRLLNPE